MEVNYFVKDKSNIVPFNVWSCGDYSKNLDGFLYNCDLELSTDYSSMGEYSLKLSKSSTTQGYYFAFWEYPISSSEYGKLATFTADLFNTTPNEEIRMVLSFDSGLNTIYVPYSENKISVAVTSEIPVNTNKLTLYLSFKYDQGITYYCDNISLTIS